MNPTQFERATGVIEKVRKCNNPDCNRNYRVPVHSVGKECPYCGSTKTVIVVEPKESKSN